ncbi:hypothetical protein EV424DRAFT_1329721, partial [Suillus variegatus]
LDSRIPILGPHFLPPSYLHARKCNPSEPAINPEVLYLKPLRVIHPFYHPELARCPRCDCTDGVLWDGWTGTGPRDVHGVMLDEAAIHILQSLYPCIIRTAEVEISLFYTSHPMWAHQCIAMLNTGGPMSSVYLIQTSGPIICTM